MITREATVAAIIDNRKHNAKMAGKAFAPSNIALIKYWGKRDQTLNLPMNSSLSISLANKGAMATIRLAKQHRVIINNNHIDAEAARRLTAYLDLFPTSYNVTLDVNIPIAAGLASSACIFAAIAQALDDLHQWQLDSQQLSILARLGSGSAARSIKHGFVEWQQGKNPDGMDSYAKALTTQWHELCIGLCIVNTTTKKISSRDGMQRTVTTSPLYPAWPPYAANALIQIRQAIEQKNFTAFGEIAEQNALNMHATMLGSWPPLQYTTSDTIQLMQQVWELRHQGTAVYFTQDAGPNLKLLFLAKDRERITQHINPIEVIHPFRSQS